MNPRFLLAPLLLLSFFCAKAFDPSDSTEIYKKVLAHYTDSVRNSLKYQTGKIMPEGGHVSLNIPAGFKFLGATQSKFVLTELWGNPAESSDDVMGMIFPEHSDPFADSSYAFVVSYSEIGYVKDEDAGKINYDDMLKNLQEEEKAENEQRIKAGYESVHIVGWAQKPFYDDKKKILHWAKELKFGEDRASNTLNYEIRILGRKGMLSLNAVSTIDELTLVNKDITKVLNIASFTEGNSYFDFDPKIDNVAAWTIGGLVAGKLLAKAGIVAVILKFLAPLWKFILLALLPIVAWFKKRFTRKKEEDYVYATANETEHPELPESASADTYLNDTNSKEQLP